MKRTLACLILITLEWGLAGCASYRLGSMLPPYVKTVYVPIAGNNTSEPFIEADVTRAVVQEIQRDGSLRLAGGPEEADAILAITVTKFELEALTYERERKTAANEYRVLLRARTILTDAKSGRVITQNPDVYGEGTFDVQGDLTSSKATALPATAKDLAWRIKDSIVEAW